MKKGVVIGVALIFSFVLVTGFVSAGFFDWITGNAVRTGITDNTIADTDRFAISTKSLDKNTALIIVDDKQTGETITYKVSEGERVNTVAGIVEVSEVKVGLFVRSANKVKATFQPAGVGSPVTNGLTYEKSQIMGREAFEDLSPTDRSSYTYEEIYRLNAKMDYILGMISSESSSKFAQFLPFTEVFFIDASGQKDSVGKTYSEPFEKIGQTVREDSLSQPISFSRAQVRLEKVGTPGDVTVTINLDASTLSNIMPGAQLATATISSNVVAEDSMNTYNFDFGETITFVPGVRYWMIVKTSILNSENHYLLEKKNDDPYPRGSQNNYKDGFWTASVDSETGAIGSVGGVVVTGPGGFDLPGGGIITVVGGIPQGPDDLWMKLLKSTKLIATKDVPVL